MQQSERLRDEVYRLGMGQHKIVCPECGPSRKKKTDRTLSINVREGSAVYNCWHCGSDGIVPLRDDLPAPRTIRERPKPMSVAKQIETQDLTNDAIDYLISRGISHETAETLGFRSGTHWIKALQKEAECLLFPYKNKSETYATKLKSIEAKGFACNGSPQTFFNIENVVADQPLIICEGELDVAACFEAGETNAVSVPNGSVVKVIDGEIDPQEDSKFRFLWAAKSQIDQASKIIIATDSDGPGQAMAEEMARRIGKERCFTVVFPDGCKDANDVLMRHGDAAVREMIKEARPWPVAGLYDAFHYSSQLYELYHKGAGRGESTGYDNIDNLYTIVPGQLCVVTGHPSSGKSELVDQIMVNLAMEKGWKFAICSFENEPRFHIAKLISKYCGKPFFDGPSGRMSQVELREGEEFVQSNFSFVHQSDGSLSSMDSIITRLKAAVLRHGIRGAVIDPYNYIAKNRDISETDWVSEVLTRLRVFAAAYGVHIWFVAHPTKMMRGPDGKVPAPKGYDISGSAAWFAKADIGMTVHRPDPIASITSEIHIWKCRFAWVGKQGKTELDFDPVSSTYRKHVPDPFMRPSSKPYGYIDDDDDFTL